MEEVQERIEEGNGTAEGAAQVDGGFTIIVEAAGHATGSALNALRALHEAVNEE